MIDNAIYKILEILDKLISYIDNLFQRKKKKENKK